MLKKVSTIFSKENMVEVITFQNVITGGSSLIIKIDYFI